MHNAQCKSESSQQTLAVCSLHFAFEVPAMIVEIQVLPHPLGTPEQPFANVDAAIAAIQQSGLKYRSPDTVLAAGLPDCRHGPVGRHAQP
jgi:hypothetical protein